MAAPEAEAGALSDAQAVAAADALPATRSDADTLSECVALGHGDIDSEPVTHAEAVAGEECEGSAADWLGVPLAQAVAAPAEVLGNADAEPAAVVLAAGEAEAGGEAVGARCVGLAEGESEPGAPLGEPPPAAVGEPEGEAAADALPYEGEGDAAADADALRAVALGDGVAPP